MIQNCFPGIFKNFSIQLLMAQYFFPWVHSFKVMRLKRIFTNDFSIETFSGKMWPEDKRNAFTKAFGKLKQKVLWKYENETLPDNPGNIKIGSWFPQRDILAHPNVKLFMTHGGLLGRY